MFGQQLLHHRHGVFDLAVGGAGPHHRKAFVSGNGVQESPDAVGAGAGGNVFQQQNVGGIPHAEQMLGALHPRLVIVRKDGGSHQAVILHRGVDDDDRHPGLCRHLQPVAYLFPVHRVEKDGRHPHVQQVGDLLVLAVLVHDPVPGQEAVAPGFHRRLQPHIQFLVKGIVHGHVGRTDQPLTFDLVGGVVPRQPQQRYQDRGQHPHHQQPADGRKHLLHFHLPSPCLQFRAPPDCTLLCFIIVRRTGDAQGQPLPDRPGNNRTHEKKAGRGSLPFAAAISGRKVSVPPGPARWSGPHGGG